MEYKNVFIALTIVTIAIIGMFSWLNEWNTLYVNDAGSSFNNTLKSTSLISNITNIQYQINQNIESKEGQGIIDATYDLTKRAISIITIIPRMIGLYESVISDIGIILNIPPVLINIGITVFIVSFGITLAYLLLLGAKKL